MTGLALATGLGPSGGTAPRQRAFSEWYPGNPVSARRRSSPERSKMARKPSPFDFLHTAQTFWSLAADAQTVIALRTLGMLGLWNTGAGESERMVAEKAEAFTHSAIASARAMARGETPDQIAMAGMRPLHRKAKSNAARLTKAGPKSPL